MIKITDITQRELIRMSNLEIGQSMRISDNDQICDGNIFYRYVKGAINISTGANWNEENVKNSKLSGHLVNIEIIVSY